MLITRVLWTVQQIFQTQSARTAARRRLLCRDDRCIQCIS